MTEREGTPHLPDEFSLIEKLFGPLAGVGALGLKDDAAIMQPAPGRDLVLTKDAIAEGRHYLPDDPPGDVARKLLRTNLSDLAAKGASPRGYLLSCAWSKSTSYDWMVAFAAGLAADQKIFGISLLGGDTIQVDGPSVFSLTAIGDVPCGEMIRRSGAEVGDDIWVTGTIGDSALGLKAALGELGERQGLGKADRDFLMERYRVPEPPVEFGKNLSGLASSAIDISDGLVADLYHLCECSKGSAVLLTDDIPLSDSASLAVSHDGDLLSSVLYGGDDYQILFSAGPERRKGLRQIAEKTNTQLTRIGQFSTIGRETVLLENKNGEQVKARRLGFNHFQSS
jgi:thiamine-monophosphate kinase